MTAAGLQRGLQGRSGVGVERPEPERVAVDVDTLGSTAVEFRTLLGLTDWRGVDNVGLPFGDTATFGPAQGLGDAHDTALTLAWDVVSRMETVHARFAEGLAEAVQRYGATDRHSAAAVRVAVEAMRPAPMTRSD
jgi:hypothetical protein